MMTEYFEHPVRAVIADSITVEIQGSQPGVVVLEDGTEIVVPPGKKITFWKQQVLEGVRAGHAVEPIDMEDWPRRDEMSAEMKAAALEGLDENPVARRYAEQYAHLNDRSTTMYDADRQNRAYESEEPMAEDLIAPLDVAVAELDDAMERLEHTLAPLLRGQGMSLTTEAITADKIGPDTRSEVRRRVAANAARLNRLTAGVRDLRERIDL
jgi:AcrR family transcriptional regulator